MNNWLNDFAQTLGIVMYWGGIAVAVLGCAVLLTALAFGIVKGASELGARMNKDARIEKELRAMLSEPR